LTVKPSRVRVFVGSSAESLAFAYAIQENLDPYDADVKVWSQGAFDIAKFGLESLLEAVRSHDFGIFVFAPDDKVISRHKRHGAVRDNVIFELGLFMGGLGRERTFVFAPRGVDLQMPSDLLGWNVERYDPKREDRTAALGVCSNKVRMAIQRLGAFRPGSPTRSVSTIREPIEARPPFRTTAGSPRGAVIRYLVAGSSAEKSEYEQREGKGRGAKPGHEKGKPGKGRNAGMSSSSASRSNAAAGTGAGGSKAKRSTRGPKKGR
jgi:hypothetical protein